MNLLKLSPIELQPVKVKIPIEDLRGAMILEVRSEPATLCPCRRPVRGGMIAIIIIIIMIIIFIIIII